MTLTDYLTEHYTAATARIYAFEIDRYLAYLGGRDRALTVGYADVVDYLVYLRKRYDNAATVRRVLYAVKAYHRFLLKTDKRPDYPAARLRLRDVERGDQVQTQDLLDADELARLREPRSERYPLLARRNVVVIGLLTYQALTVCEIGRLRVGDVDLTGATVSVAATPRTLARRLKLAAPQVMELYAYLKEDRPRLLDQERIEGPLPQSTDALVLTSRGTTERGEGVHYLVETLRPLVPGKRLTPTLIRQSVIALKLKNGEGLRQTQVFAGHKKVSTTERYRETNLEELRRAVQRCHPLGNSMNN
jgi:integrase/recombinase XerD